MTGVFVTGTDTGIGKTLVSAWLVRHWRADYWKPVQTGTVEGRDLDVIRRQGVPGDGRRPTLFPSAYEFSAPLSPHAAAALEGTEIVLDRLTAPASELLVVEGAGGALVPLNGQFLMVDLMVRLGLPVLVVARSGLGTINHTLLTLEALRARHLRIAGVVMSGEPNPGNRAAIESHGRVAVLAELPWCDDLALLPPPPAVEILG